MTLLDAKRRWWRQRWWWNAATWMPPTTAGKGCQVYSHWPWWVPR